MGSTLVYLSYFRRAYFTKLPSESMLSFRAFDFGSLSSRDSLSLSMYRTTFCLLFSGLLLMLMILDVDLACAKLLTGESAFLFYYGCGTCNYLEERSMRVDFCLA